MIIPPLARNFEILSSAFPFGMGDVGDPWQSLKIGILREQLGGGGAGCRVNDSIGQGEAVPVAGFRSKNREAVIKGNDLSLFH